MLFRCHNSIINTPFGFLAAIKIFFLSSIENAQFLVYTTIGPITGQKEIKGVGDLRSGALSHSLKKTSS